jgi:hypothetical protein
MSTTEFGIQRIHARGIEQPSSSSCSRRDCKLNGSRSNLQRLVVLSTYLAATMNVTGAEAKREVVTTSLGGKQEEEHTRWRYVSKFGFTTGEGTYRVRAKLRNLPAAWQAGGDEVTLQVEAYLDEDWPEVEREEVFCSRSGKARGFKDLLIPRNLSWGEWTVGSVHQHIRPHVWYYAVSDCTRSLVRSHIPNRI